MNLLVYLVDLAVSKFSYFFQNFENIFDLTISTLLLELFDEMSNLALQKWSMIEQTAVNIE